jgi:hypothetical protein
MSAKRWLEVRIPISPLDHYFNRIRFIALSIRTLGGQYTDALIRVSVGADQEPDDLYQRLPWSRELGIEWHWVDRSEFLEWKNTKHPYIATMMERFRPPFSAEHVLMMDADVVAMQPFDEMFKQLSRHPGVIGVMAHHSPFEDAPISHEQSWRRFYSLAGIGEPKFDHRHTGWGLMDDDRSRENSPAYFNTGVLMANASVFEQLYLPYMSMLNLVRTNMDNYYFEQIALTLTLVGTGIAYHTAPLRYNFPNDPSFDIAHTDELRHVRFIHFLRSGIIQRESDFRDLDATVKLTKRNDLTGSNELFRRRLVELMPFALPTERP